MEKIKLNDLKVFEVDVWVGAGKFDVYLVRAEDQTSAIQQVVMNMSEEEVIGVTAKLLD